MKDRIVKWMIICIIVLLCAGGCILLANGDIGIGVFMTVYAIWFALNADKLAKDE